MCHIGASAHDVRVGVCTAAASLAGVSVPFSNYFVSHYASQDLWHIGLFSGQSPLFIVALSLEFLELLEQHAGDIIHFALVLIKREF